MSFTTSNLAKVLLFCSLLAFVHSDTVTFHVREQEPTRTVVGNVIEQANLRDVYTGAVLAELRFRFRDPDSLFEIVESTGVIRTRRVIDREQLPECMYTTSCSFDLDVLITPYAHFRIVPIVIYVDDINDHAPEFQQPRVSLTIPENVAVNGTYILPSAEDPDSSGFGVQRYELVTDTDVFDINVNVLPDGSKDLSIKVLQSLDRENKNFYSVQIRALDGGNPAKSGTMIVDISVGDTNDNNPVFESRLYEAHIYENLEPDTPVVQVSARDLDEGDNGEIHYEFEQLTETEFGSFFGINERTGLIFVKGDIDYETHKSFHLKVVAKDLGKSTVPDYTRVDIIIIDVNDNAPVISVNTFSESPYARVPENVEAGHTVAYVGVSDPDTGPGGNITCGIDNGHFQIQGRPNSGFDIVSSHPFDREQEAQYSLLVHCEDQGSPQQSSSVRISIHVTDENDNNPIFIPNSDMYTLSVPENNNIGDVLMKVNASDKDTMENAAIRYSMVPVGDTPDGVVSIDLITGVIRANIEFDFEKQDFYQFRVMATDQGSPSRVVQTLLALNVVDVNDGFPHFTRAAYSFNVAENQVANTRVGSISAVDNDAAPFDRIIYSLEPGRDSYKFDINADTGEIVTATILDREEAPVFYLVGVASNLGSSKIRTTVNITINIDDDNDNPPLIMFPTDVNNTVQVPTRMDIGYHVTQIEASDPDDEDNARLKFSISSGNEGGLFSIDPDTGAISTAISTDMSNLKTQRLVLKVKDSGVPEKITFARLNVVFNSSVAVTKGLLAKDTITVLIVAAIAGCVSIVIVITVAICCIRRSKDKKERKEHVYNCRAEEAKKALSNGDRQDSNSSGDSPIDKSVDTGINKNKEKSKKEVTFSVDMDVGWPMQNEKAVIENPHAQHIDPSDCRPPAHPERVRSPVQGEDDPDGTGRPVSRQNSCCTCMRAPPLTQQNLDMLEYNLLWNSVDRDSESGCSGTDSGRGPSEEGECGHHGGDGQHGHDAQCGHGTCCCSSGIYAKKFHPHLHPNMYNSGHLHPGQRGCHCCGPVHSCNTCSHGHSCGPACGQGVKRNTSHCSVDECTPLESLPPFGRPHFQNRMYPKASRYTSDCPGARSARQRLALDPAEMAKHRHYGYAPSLPSLTDRHTPSPTFTSASDSQFYPYTGAHQQPNRALYPGGKSGNTAFHPIPMKRTPSREDDQSLPGSMTMSDDGTTMSGSYSLENMQQSDHPKSVRLAGGPAQDCYV